MSAGTTGETSPGVATDGQAEALLRGVVQELPKGGLAERLKDAAVEGRPLRVKLGIDPSSPRLHLGHSVALRKLAQFQACGHVVVLIIGDLTARIGDPTGRSAMRPRQSAAEVDAHAQTYLGQAGRVLDLQRVEVRRNSEWLAPLDLEQMIELAAEATVAQLLEREDFRARHGRGDPISLVEFLYPLLQGQDSVAVRADVEIGGTDQTFNLLMGRQLQRSRGDAGQVALTLPLLEGLDGVHKMSKSLGNTVDLDEDAATQFGKLMHVPDALIERYALLCSSLGLDTTRRLGLDAARGGSATNAAKREMARAVVDWLHGQGAGSGAQASFDMGVRVRAGAHGSQSGEDMRAVPIPESAYEPQGVWLVALLAEAGFATSRTRARQLLADGAVRLDGRALGARLHWPADELDGHVLSVGRRPPVRLRAQPGHNGQPSAETDSAG